MRIKRIVWQVLEKNVSKWQLVGYALANAVGLMILLIGIMFYCDMNCVTADRYISRDYVVLSKHVDGVGFAPITFSDDEISQLEKQNWVKRIGCFTPPKFSVQGSVSFHGRTLISELFIESVPNDFFDILPADWNFDSQNQFVPIVLNKEYLALYNFGFAAPQGLPQIGEEIVQSIPLRLILRGDNGRSKTYNARIVGFSSRLNTIAVPQEFMEWANEYFSNDYDVEPSRLIAEVDRLYAAEMDSYLAKNELDVSGNDFDSNAFSELLRLLVTVVSVVGILICTLSVFILVLSITLLLQKNKERISNLVLLGYSTREIAFYYHLIVLTINVGVVCLSLILMYCARQVWLPMIEKFGFGGAAITPVCIAAIIYLLVVSLYNYLLISKKIKKI